MKILAISGSPRQKGNTMLILEKALAGAAVAGAETELFSAAGKDIRPCDGCWACIKKGACHIQDDMAELYGKMKAADGIIFGTPIYFWAMTAQAKAVIDRSIAMPGHDALANKVCGVVAVAGSLGLVDAFKDYAYYIVQKRMIPANFISAYVQDPRDTANMEGLMKDADDLGKQMVALAEQGFKYLPEYIKPPGAYGVHGRM